MADAAPASRGGFKSGFGGDKAGGAGGRGRGKQIFTSKDLNFFANKMFFKLKDAAEVVVVAVELEETRRETRRNGFQ